MALYSKSWPLPDIIVPIRNQGREFKMKFLPDSPVVYAGMKVSRKATKKRSASPTAFDSLTWEMMDSLLKSIQDKKKKVTK